MRQFAVQNDDFCDDFRAAFPHLLRFGEKNRRSHFPPQNVVYMQKGIKIGPVVWPLTRSFPHFLNHFLISPQIKLYIISRILAAPLRLLSLP